MLCSLERDVAADTASNHRVACTPLRCTETARRGDDRRPPHPAAVARWRHSDNEASSLRAESQTYDNNHIVKTCHRALID